MSSGTAVAVALTATAGLAGAVQAAVMGELGERVGVVPAVAFSVVLALLGGLAALLVWERSFAGIRAAAQEPAWLWVGGLMSVFIVLAVTVAPPSGRLCWTRTTACSSSASSIRIPARSSGRHRAAASTPARRRRTRSGVS